MFPSDNPDADIYGANLYNRYLQYKMAKLARLQVRRSTSSPSPAIEPDVDHWVKSYLPDDTLSIEEVDSKHLGVEQVRTGLLALIPYF